MALAIKTFGTFSIESETKCITDRDNHSRKIWTLIAYLLYNKNRVVSQNELVKILWNDVSGEVNPLGALKTLLYRARAVLDKLWDGAGMQLILTSGTGYVWNPDYPTTCDFEEFDQLSKLPDEINAEDTDRVVSLLRLFQGPFLQKFASEFWVMPLSEYFHQIHMHSLQLVLPFLWEQKRHEEIADFARLECALEPFNEDLHCHLMRAYIALDKKDLAIDVYQKFSDKLMSELGVMPSKQLRAAYHEATRKGEKSILTSSALKELLLEQNSLPGALVCDFDFFCVLYHSMARSVLRNGIAVHLVLVSTHEKGAKMTEKKRQKVMETLGDVLRCCLRRGDTASLCSAQQYVIMLPRANYENSCMVCERIAKSWSRRNMASTLDLHFEVFPLQPDEMERF